MLWVLQALNTVYNYTILVPVKFKNLPQNKKPLIQLPNNISIDIKASGLKLALALANKPFKPLEIDFNSLKSINKQQSYVLTSNTINIKSVFKFETQIKRINPDTLYFSEKNGYQKIVPVKIPLNLKCTQGYGYKQPIINPAFVTIWGDTSTINKIDTIYSQAVNLINIHQNYHADLAIVKPNLAINISNDLVNVSIEICKLIEQTITLPIHVSDIPNTKQIAIFPSTVHVKFTSLQNSFINSDTLLFKATINPLKVNANNKCPIILKALPNNITVLTIEPKDVEILIIKK